VWISLLMLAGACSTPDEPLKSKPVGELSTNIVAVDMVRGQRPDGRATLVLGRRTAAEVPVPGLAALAPGPQAEAMAVLNSTTAPCLPCMNEGISLADCLVQPHSTCPNLVALGRRIVRAAASGEDRHAIQPKVLYAAPWQPTAGVGLPVVGTVDAPVQVVLVLDPGDPFSAQMKEPWAGLAGDPRVAISLLLLPRERHLGSRAAARAILGGGEQSWELHGALLGNTRLGDEDLDALGAGLGLEMATWKEARKSTAVESQLQRFDVQAQALGVESTPMTLVNGYRVPGVRSLAFLKELVDRELADLEI
jgi:protein-disulfide isomerase